MGYIGLAYFRKNLNILKIPAQNIHFAFKKNHTLNPILITDLNNLINYININEN